MEKKVTLNTYKSYIHVLWNNTTTTQQRSSGISNANPITIILPRQFRPFLFKKLLHSMTSNPNLWMKIKATWNKKIQLPVSPDPLVPPTFPRPPAPLYICIYLLLSHLHYNKSNCQKLVLRRLQMIPYLNI